MNEELRQLVWRRADARCEYCRVPQSHDPLPFGVDHILPRYHHGPTVADNLALACFHCNSFKSSHVAGYDDVTGELSELFNPRSLIWVEHFAIVGGRIVGRTVIGRTTIDVLRMNLAERVEYRRLLDVLGVLAS